MQEAEFQEASEVLRRHFIFTAEATFDMPIRHGEAFFVIVEKSEERRFMIDIRTRLENKRFPLLRIRTRGDGNGRHRPSGKIIIKDGSYCLLHDRGRVNNPDRRPLPTNEVIFEGKSYSCFEIDGKLPQVLSDYELTRPLRSNESR